MAYTIARAHEAWQVPGMARPLREQLRDAMEHAGLSVSELSRRMGYADHNVVSRTLSGKTQPPADRIESWAAECGYRVQLVPLHPEGADLSLTIAPLNAEERALLARIAGVLPELHPIEVDILEKMIGGLEQKYATHQDRAQK